MLAYKAADATRGRSVTGAEPAGLDIPQLDTARLRLRARTPADAEALYPTLADAALMRWWSRGPFGSVAEVRDYFAPGPQSAGWRSWAITSWDGHGGDRAIGYVLERAAWGRGVAREAVSAVIDRLFAEGQRRIFADTDPENAASIALLTRLGFMLEGHLRAEWETHIGVRDSLIFGLLRGEWGGAGSR